MVYPDVGSKLKIETMGLFDLFGNRKKQDELAIKRLELESTKRKYLKHQNNKKRQSEMVPLTVEQLRKLEVDPGDQLKLEFFFYSSKKENAEKLKDHLETEFSYEVHELHKTEHLWAITGWTNPQPILTELIQEWSDKMCDIAYKFDSEFDGWGTTPEQ